MPDAQSYHQTQTMQSEAFRELLVSSPARMLRMGPIAFLHILLLLITICWFIQYPDVVSTSATLTSENGPRELRLPVAARVQHVWANEGLWVNEGDPIAVLENTADVNDVIRLYKLLDSIVNCPEATKISAAKLLIHELQHASLGDLQESWHRLQLQWLQVAPFLPGGHLAVRKGLLKTDSQWLLLQRDHLAKQTNLSTADTALSHRDFEAETLLANQQVLSPFEYRAAQSRMHVREQAVLQWEALLLNNDVQQHEKLKELVDIDGQYTHQWLMLHAEIIHLQSQVEKWMQTYMLRAPISGILNYTRPLLPGEVAPAATSICSITPRHSRYMATFYIPQQGIGMVDTGQIVHLHFAAYPVQQFGRLEGTLHYIARLPADSGYFAQVRLPDTLFTHSRFTIPYREGLVAEARIITSNRRLLHRFYQHAAILLQR
jgi:HlyD family secretion protein